MLANLLLASMTPCAIASFLESPVEHENERGRHEITLVLSKPLKAHAPLLKSLLSEALHKSEERLGLPLMEDTYYVIDSDELDHNGLTTVIPNNRVFVYTEPPALGSSIGISRDYLRETLIHETGHLLSLQRHHGVFSLLDFLFGNVARPNGAWPRWIHEGIAVWTEDVEGGRPSSGSVDYDLRRYAEAYRSGGQQHPMGSADLDGTGRLERFNEGQVPYTFGYLLIEAASKKLPIADFTEASASSLGISFRPAFRAQGIDLDALLKEEQAKWASTPLGSEAPGRRETARAPQIIGPFRGEGSRIAWIERDPWSRRIEIASAGRPGAKPRRLEWKHSLQTPLVALPVSDDTWILLLRSHPNWEDGAFFDRWLPFQREAVLYSPSKRAVLCRFKLPPRVRELSVQGERLAWIDAPESGRLSANRARWSSDCALSEREELAHSLVPFERLSGLALGAGDGWSLSRSPGRDSYRERVETSEGSWDLGFAMGWAQPIGARGEQWIAQEFSREHWGPVLVTRKGESLEARRIPVVTGSQGVISSENRVFVNEGYWHEDRLAEVSVAQLIELPISYRGRFIATNPAPRSAAEANPFDSADKDQAGLKDYGPWPSIWPHFWLPNLSATDRGVSLQAGSFYEDLSGEWRGNTWLGYETLTRRPGVSTSLAYRSHALSGAYAPVPLAYFGLTGARAQDRWHALYFRDFPYAFDGRYQGYLQASIEYEAAADAPGLAGYTFVIPGLRGGLSSQHGRNPNTSLSPLSQAESGWLVEHRLRFIRALEASASLHGQMRLGRSALMTSIQGAGTGSSNYPASYFVWGGLPSLGTGSSSYLARGFVPRAAAARAVLRGGLEWAWPLWSDNVAFSWNRLGLDDADLKLVAETLSWDSFNPSSPYRIGRQAFTTLGSELDVYGSALHYVRYRMSLGLFRGLGEFGETRVSLVLRSGIDL